MNKQKLIKRLNKLDKKIEILKAKRQLTKFKLNQIKVLEDLFDETANESKIKY